MREFAKISCSIWGSEKFTGLPNDDARLLYLYLHTCPHVNSLGCYVLRPGYAMSDLGWDVDPEGAIRYRNGIEALSKANLIGFDKQHSLIRIVDFLKYSPFANPKHAKGALRILDDLPDCDEKSFLISDIERQKHLPDDFLGHEFDTVSIRYQNSSDIPETRDPRPETKGRGGEEGTRATAVADAPSPGPSLVSQLADALGFNDPDGRGWPKYWAAADAHIIASRWITDLGLTASEVIEVAVSNAKAHGTPANGPRTLTRHMQAFAAAKNAPPLEIPAQPTGGLTHDRAIARDRRQAAADDALQRRLYAAARVD
ncbi:hypothetical protein JWJ88_17285 [Paracoccus methylovorus]|uniref:Uncharacterized protein n=1 Tax=Paracoccus methylovorus TaxID=2812658 RepID=A0ABX7JNA3_9RHOB|nr:hypothetical protein [Paracoccus methylovorus]QRZ14718.1 hypothetical protein JWJ88_17285 [Paracoccus methylovorus]